MSPSADIKCRVHRIFLVVCIAVSACQGGGGTVERLDSQSGLTIVTDREPVAFARTETRFSRSARDYVYLGPVELNERGAREYYLWVGIASTIDRNYLAAEATIPDLLYLNLAGEPMEFELTPWDERISQLARRTIYEPAVAPTVVLAARVTLDQLMRIAEAKPESIRIAGRDAPTMEYLLWNETSRWTAFASF
jgi:hypothetical protein